MPPLQLRNTCISACIPASTLVVALLLLPVTAGSFAASGAETIPRAAAAVSQIVAHRGASVERPECTLAAIRRAVEVGASAIEVDVRTSRDGQLFLLHDSTLDRTTNGQGPASQRTLEELQRLDAGSWFDKKYQGERIPRLREALAVCRDQADILLDLKEQGDRFAQQVAAEVRQYGDPARTIVGARSVAQARQFRKLLPETRQLGLIPRPASVGPFAEAGVETIRLWPRWLEGAGAALPARVRALEAQLHLNGTRGEGEETRQLLRFAPNSLSSDDPARLLKTLREISGRGPLPRYTIRRARRPIAIDGLLDEKDWKAASPVSRFRFAWWKQGAKETTEARLLWDDRHLYVAFRCQDAHVSAKHASRDSAVYLDDCVEVFAAPNPARPNDYYNLEMNALGAMLDQHHPRGAGVPVDRPWNSTGVQVRVKVDGTLNNDADVDRGWVLEAAIPFSNYAAAARHTPPRSGDIWRLNLNRCGGKTNPQYSQWSPSRTASPAFHVPRDFGFVRFSKSPAGSR